MAANNQRRIDIKYQISGDDAKSIEYNPASGGQKSLPVGPRFLPIPIASGYTTTPTTTTALPFLGLTLYVYNNAGTAGSVTIGKVSTITSQAIGVSDASGNVGIACPPNAYTPISMGDNRYIITSAATLIVYIVEDPTTIIQETGPYAQQNPPIEPVS